MTGEIWRWPAANHTRAAFACWIACQTFIGDSGVSI
jgi:hypothetical protein